MKQKLLALALASLPSLSQIAPVLAQQQTAQQQTAAVSPDTPVNLPGLYYDPDPGPSPTFQQLTGAEQAGYIETPPLPNGVTLPYQVDRAWPEGATPDGILKFGDLEQNPVTAGFTKLTLRDISAQQGTNIAGVPVGDVPLVGGLTVGQVDNLYTKIGNGEKIEVKDAAPAVQAALGVLEDPSQAGKQLQQSALTNGQKILITKLSKIPALKGIPLQDLARGNWEGVISKAEQIELAGIGKKIGPTLKKLPVNQIVPIVGDAINGNWKQVRKRAQAYILEKGTNIAVKEVIKAVPELKNLPLGAVPDIVNQPIEKALPKVADLAIEEIPGAKDKTINSVPGLSEIPVDKLPFDLAFSFLAGDVFARFDIAFSGSEGKEEPSIDHALSGGSEDQKFKPTKCTVGKSKQQRADNCPHFEMRKFVSSPLARVTGDDDIEGKQWVQGHSKGKNGQGVKGGKGLWKIVNGGWEPAGIHPFGTGSHTKFVLKKITEYPDKPSTAKLHLAIQACIDIPLLGEQCTPHFVVIPTPFTVREGGLFLVASRRNLPAEIARLRNQGLSAAGFNQVYCDPNQLVATAGQSDSGTANTKYGHQKFEETDDELFAVTSVSGTDVALTKDAAESFEQMRADAAAQGLDIKAVSGFRDKQLQERLFTDQVAEQGSAEAAAKISAPAGHSEHHTGLAVDVGNNQNATLEETWADTAEYKWMQQNAGKYGYELSFPNGNSQGVTFEPWHWRYVGTDQAAATFSPTADDGQSPATTASSANGVLQPIEGGSAAPQLDGIPGQPNAVSRPSPQKVDKLAGLSESELSQHRASQYLARIALGETDNGTNIGDRARAEAVNGPYGIYQFKHRSRNSLLERQGLDAWSSDPQEQAQAAWAWIQVIGDEKGVDLHDAIQRGDFEKADRVLAAGQFTSLPGGPEQSRHWQDPSKLEQYGPNGQAPEVGTAPAPLLASSGLPCKPGAIASANGPRGTLIRGKGEPGKTYPDYYDPVPGVPINSERGWRWGKWHAGVDQAAPEGTPVLATNGGNVVAVFNTCTNNGDQGCGYGWGNHIIIRHEDGTHSKYAHLSPGTIAVEVGMDIGRGDQIAGIGNTGHSTGPHLHYEQRINTNPNDPYSGDDVEPRDYVIFGG